MAVVSAQVSVPTTAGGTLLSTAADADVGLENVVVLLNVGAVDVFLGPSGVTTATGLKLAVGASLSLRLGASESLYGIVASGTGSVHSLLTGV